MVPGLDLFTLFDDLFGSEVMITQINRGDRTSLFTSLVSAANAQDISFYTIGAAGLHTMGCRPRSTARPMTRPHGGARRIPRSMRYMADGTGGVALVDSNDFTGRIRAYRQRSLHLLLPRLHSSTSAVPTRSTGSRSRCRAPGLHLRLPAASGGKINSRTRVQDKVLTGLMFDLDEQPDGVIVLDVVAQRPAAEAASTGWCRSTSRSPSNVSPCCRRATTYVGQAPCSSQPGTTCGKRSDLCARSTRCGCRAADYELAQDKRFGITSGLLMESGSYRVVGVER